MSVSLTKGSAIRNIFFRVANIFSFLLRFATAPEELLDGNDCPVKVRGCTLAAWRE